MLRRVALALVIVMCMCVPAHLAAAADKITTDPNAAPRPGQAVVVVDALEADPRLDQKITYSDGHRNVHEVVDSLASVSGVKLRAGYTLSDWIVRERKINVFVQDVSLRDVMRAIARVMRFRWDQYEHDGIVSYRLVVDTKLIRETESARRKWQERYMQAAVKARTDLIDRALFLKAATSEERDRVKREEPFCYQLEIAGVNEFLSALVRDYPDVRNAIVQGTPLGPLEIPVSKLSTPTKKLIRQAADGWDRIQGLSERQVRYLSPELDSRLSEGTINVAMDEIAPATPADLSDPPDNYLSNHGAITITVDDEYYDLVLFDTPATRWPPVARAIVTALEGKKSFRQARDEEYRKLDEHHPPAEPPKVLPCETDRKWLEKKHRLEFKDTSLTGIEQALFRTAQLNIVSDDFRYMPMLMNLGNFDSGQCSGEEKTVEGWLEHIRHTFTYDVAKHKDIVLLNRHDWFDRRDTQLPQSMVGRWRKDVERNGYLPLEDAVEIALLPWGQRRESVEEDAVLGSHGIGSAIHGADRDMARLYSSLGDAQRWALTNGRGLPLSALDPVQWQYAPREMLKRANLVSDAANAPVLAFSRRRFDHGGVTHVFTLTGPGGAVIAEWEIPGGELRRKPNQ